MPDLYVPVFVGDKILSHQISCWLIDGQKVITGAMNGEIVIWQDWVPQFQLLVLHGVGSVTAMCIIKRPFAEFSDNKLSCIVSFHQDKRMRVWSMQDGKLILISDHDQFPYTDCITYVAPIGEKDSRYLICFGQGRAVYIYDLWKMKCKREVTLEDEFADPIMTMLHFVQGEFAIIDSKSRIYKLDIRDFRREEKQNYLKSLQKIKSGIKQHAKIRLSSAYSLKGLPSKKVINSVYNPRSEILIIAYSKCIAIVNQPFKQTDQQREMCFITSSHNIAKFRGVQRQKNIYLFEQTDGKYQYILGSCSFIQDEDLSAILKLLSQTSQSSVNMGFSAFSFYKQSSQCIGYLQLNLRSQLPFIKPSQYFMQQQIYLGERILRQNGVYFEEFIINELPNELKIMKNDIKLQSDGYTLMVNSECFYVNEKFTQQNIFEVSSKNDSQQHEIFRNISCIGVYAKHDLFAFQIENKIIYAHPYFMIDKVYKYEHSHPIQATYFVKNNLFVIDNRCEMLVFSFSSIFGRFAGQNVPLVPTFRGSLPSQIKSVMQIRLIDQLSTTFMASDLQQINKKLIKHLVAFLLDDAIIIYNATLNQKVALLQQRNSELLFYAPAMAYYYVVANQQVSIWHENGIYERTVSLEYLQQVFNLENTLKDQMLSIQNPNNYKNLKSGAFDLLEFSNRSYSSLINYGLAQTYYYETLGLLLSINTNKSLEFADLLSISNQDNGIIYKSKSIVIMPFSSTVTPNKLIQLHCGNKFQRLNKCGTISQERQHNTFILWFDCKRSYECGQKLIENCLSQRVTLSYTHFYLQTQSKFECEFGMQGMGGGFSRAWDGSHEKSGLMSALYGLGAALMQHQVKVQGASILSLARFTLDDDKNIIELACSLIRSAAGQQSVLYDTSRDFLAYFDKIRENPTTFFSLELMCLVIQVYLLNQNSDEQFILSRLVQGIQQNTLLTNSNVAILCIKLIDDGIIHFQKHITKTLIQHIVLQLYYYVNTVHKHRDLAIEHLQVAKKKDEVLRQFLALPSASRLRQQLKHLLMTIAQNMSMELRQIIKEQLLMNETPLMANTLIDLSRHILRDQISSRELGQFLDQMIKTIDQSNVALRRTTFKSLMKFLRMLDLKYARFSLQEERLKAALANEGVIQLYDLRYGVKLSSLDRYQTSITSIAFDIRGTQLASFSAKDQTIKIFQLKPSGSFLQNYENVYIKLTHQFINVKVKEAFLRWDQDCKYIYLWSDEEQQVYLVK